MTKVRSADYIIH